MWEWRLESRGVQNGLGLSVPKGRTSPENKTAFGVWKPCLARKAWLETFAEGYYVNCINGGCLSPTLTKKGQTAVALYPELHVKQPRNPSEPFICSRCIGKCHFVSLTTTTICLA